MADEYGLGETMIWSKEWAAALRFRPGSELSDREDVVTMQG
jgi:hypothetical protein